MKNKKILLFISMCFVSLSASEIDDIIDKDMYNKEIPKKYKSWENHTDNGQIFYEEKTAVTDMSKAKKIFKNENIQLKESSEDRVLLTVNETSSKVEDIFLKENSNKAIEDISKGMKGKLTYYRLLLKYKNKEGGFTSISLKSEEIKSFQDLQKLYKTGLVKQDELLKEFDPVTVELKILSESERINGIQRKEAKIISTAKTSDGDIVSTETLQIHKDGIEIVPTTMTGDLNGTDKNGTISNKQKGNTFWNNPSIK